MNITYYAPNKQLKFTDAMKDHFEGHFKKLEKFINGEPTKVSLEKEGDELILKSQVVLKGNRRIRSEARGLDYYTLVADIISHLEKQISKMKYNHKNKSGIKVFTEANNSEESIIFKTKELILDNTSVEEAISSMEDLGHTWWAFRDVDQNNRAAIVYKRFDDTYGLINLI